MQSNDPLLAFCNCADPASAKNIAHWLVENRLAACVNIVPNVESVYRWQGEVTIDNEVTLLIKTNSKLLQTIKAELPQQHSYELPEIIAVSIADGLPEYLAWLDQNLAPTT